VQVSPTKLFGNVLGMSQPCATHCRDGVDSDPNAHEYSVGEEPLPLDGSYPEAQAMAQLCESARIPPLLWHGLVVPLVDEPGTVCGGRLVGMVQLLGTHCSDGGVSTLERHKYTSVWPALASSYPAAHLTPHWVPWSIELPAMHWSAPPLPTILVGREGGSVHGAITQLWSAGLKTVFGGHSWHTPGLLPPHPPRNSGGSNAAQACVLHARHRRPVDEEHETNSYSPLPQVGVHSEHFALVRTPSSHVWERVGECPSSDPTASSE
jgi:hypothetical protein